MTVAGQPTVNYSFDAANRLIQIMQGSSTVQFSYDAASRRTTLTLPNGVVTTYSYDRASQLTGMTYSFSSTVLGNLAYGYDLGGRRSSMTGSFARTGIPYAVTSATYDANNRLTSWGGTPLSYDLNGNMTGDVAHGYTWDARNHLTQIDSGATATFSYDALGRRVNKNILGASTSFLYDGANPVQELSGNAPTANLLTGSLDEHFTRTDAAGPRNFLTDALGSTLALSDSTGTVQTSYTFEPFGNTSINGSPSTNSFVYTGRELDAGNLYFYRARYYSSLLQRFISEDPARLGGGSLNFYAYVGNDPINQNDPLGLFAPPWHSSITWAAAAANNYGYFEANALAWDTAMVDFRNCEFVFFGGSDCSQNPDAYHSNTHSMAGRKPNGKPQTCQQAFQGAQQQLIDDINSGDTPKALHTIEDAYAGGHLGFQFWPGGGS